MLSVYPLVLWKVSHAGYRSRMVTMSRTLDLKDMNPADGQVMVAAEGEGSVLERF
jgi:acylphosphatase